MNDSTNASARPRDGVDWSSRIRVGSAATATPTQGRRAFFNYRDLGIKAASNGRLSATLVDVTQGLSQPTGWHYHACDAQFLYVTSGWVILQFEDGTTRKVLQGQTLYIEGGVRHNEIATSDDFGYLEIFLPADMRTVACERPAGWVDGEAQVIA